MRSVILSGLLWFMLSAPQTVFAESFLLQNVPSYYWTGGCAPTAAAMILGYWDLNGYENLFSATEVDSVKLTNNVKNHISSTLEPSLASYMETQNGGTYTSKIDDGLRAYTLNKGYNFASEYFNTNLDNPEDQITTYWDSLASVWTNFLFEIKQGPVLFNVDIDDNGEVDHSITAIGYEITQTNDWLYACYDTWNESESAIKWYQFKPISSQASGSPKSGTNGTIYGGIHSMLYVHPGSAVVGNSPVPEPTTVLLFSTGLAGLVGAHSRKRRQFFGIISIIQDNYNISVTTKAADSQKTASRFFSRAEMTIFTIFSPYQSPGTCTQLPLFLADQHR